MVKYTCERCGIIFKQKQHYQKHKDRKNKCVAIDEKIGNIIDLKIEEKMNEKKDIKEHKKSIHEKGQYFTTNSYLKDCVYKLINNKPNIILEPSVGQGDLVEYVKSKPEFNKTKFDLYEIDTSIKLLENVNEKVNYGDFLKYKIDNKYDTIIGNPPYVKTQTGNLYIDFIDKCYKLLNDDGELIFIVPSDFIKLTSSSRLINDMMSNGTFTHIIHPNKESLFEYASIDVIIFRYCKNSSLDKKIMVNNVEKYLINTNGILTYSETSQENFKTLSDYFNIYVGMVTGKEDVFKNETYGNLDLLNGKGIVEKYIMIDTFPTTNEDLNKYLSSKKDILKERKIRKFNDKNWYEWGAPRNYKNIKDNIGKDCIYVSNLTRNKEVCFIDKVQYFGGSLIMMIPKNTNDNNHLDLKKIANFINSENFKSNYMYSGRFKIGHKQLCNCLIQPTNFL
jgi:adenine-specific DNA-methyltransferase